MNMCSWSRPPLWDSNLSIARGAKVTATLSVKATRRASVVAWRRPLFTPCTAQIHLPRNAGFHLHSAVCCARRSNSLGIWSICGWRSVRAAVVWHEPRIAEQPRSPAQCVLWQSRDSDVRMLPRTCDTKLSSEWHIHECAVLSPGAMRNSSAVLFRRHVNSCEHNSCIPKCDNLQRLSWLWDESRPCRPADCGSPIVFGNSHLVHGILVCRLCTLSRLVTGVMWVIPWTEGPGMDSATRFSHHPAWRQERFHWSMILAFQ